jgi:hypothetical protein
MKFYPDNPVNPGHPDSDNYLPMVFNKMKQADNPLIMYRTEDGQTTIEVKVESERNSVVAFFATTAAEQLG